MGSRKRQAAEIGGAEDDVRNQEVLRANRELAAYFRGKRTEREARAALKIIKAFLRDRERLDPAKRRPLPGAQSSQRAAQTQKPKKATSSEMSRHATKETE